METLAILSIAGVGLLLELYLLEGLREARAVKAMIRPHVKLLLLRKRRLPRTCQNKADLQAAWEAERRSLYLGLLPRRARLFVGLSTFGTILDAEFASVPAWEIERWTRIDRLSADWFSFEAEIAADLKARGWQVVEVGDEHYLGADLYAYRHGFVAALQCRFSDAPVGGRAVQEAASIRLRLDAQIVCIVSNNEYTPAARRMADESGVFLLHSSDLDDIEPLRAEVAACVHAATSGEIYLMAA